MTRILLTGVVAIALMTVAAPAPASGITNDKLAYLTFSAPVQVPGVILDAGRYRFRLTNSETSRNVVQVLSGDGSIVYAMFNTILDHRTQLTADPFVTFRETPADVPPAVKSLFYGWESLGYEFVYPGGPIMTVARAEAPETAVVTEPWMPAAPVLEPTAEEPAPAPEPAVEAAPVEPVAPPIEPAPAELERTATPLPLIALGGAAALLAGLVLRRRRG